MANSETIWNAVETWGPMAVVLVIWIFFIWRMRSGSPYQIRTAEQVQAQLDEAKRQTAVLERIANALEKK